MGKPCTFSGMVGSPLMNLREDRRNIGEKTIIVGAQGPVDKERAPDDITRRHKSPGARVIAIDAIIAHHKVLSRGTTRLLTGLSVGEAPILEGLTYGSFKVTPSTVGIPFLTETTSPGTAMMRLT